MKLRHKFAKYINEKTGYTPHVEEPLKPISEPIKYPTMKNIFELRGLYKVGRHPLTETHINAIKTQMAIDLSQQMLDKGHITFERHINEYDGAIQYSATVTVLEELR
ncbi:hypothetical protein ACWN8V_06755 [Vagococcus elongatus]|uniref:Uncharacterized protein n=1 Tax=Vagococcus elongatus TaxID=180344 RepID=A0A430AW00_9ENTE|nr:hypothetical protein [Vagococcus elongatus]RSU12233.1 hypothetical protein CBF29_06445 [Vagococcus elongatus]